MSEVSQANDWWMDGWMDRAKRKVNIGFSHSHSHLHRKTPGQTLETSWGYSLTSNEWWRWTSQDLCLLSSCYREKLKIAVSLLKKSFKRKSANWRKEKMSWSSSLKLVTISVFYRFFVAFLSLFQKTMEQLQIEGSDLSIKENLKSTYHFLLHAHIVAAESFVLHSHYRVCILWTIHLKLKTGLRSVSTVIQQWGLCEALSPSCYLNFTVRRVMKWKNWLQKVRPSYFLKMYFSLWWTCAIHSQVLIYSWFIYCCSFFIHLFVNILIEIRRIQQYAGKPFITYEYMNPFLVFFFTTFSPCAFCQWM